MPVLSIVRSKVSDQQNDSLCQPFTAAEVVAAVKSMHPDKSPGPDGFNPCFYQKFWPEIGMDVI